MPFYSLGVKSEVNYEWMTVWTYFLSACMPSVSFFLDFNYLVIHSNINISCIYELPGSEDYVYYQTMNTKYYFGDPEETLVVFHAQNHVLPFSKCNISWHKIVKYAIFPQDGSNITYVVLWKCQTNYHVIAQTQDVYSRDNSAIGSWQVGA